MKGKILSPILLMALALLLLAGCGGKEPVKPENSATTSKTPLKNVDIGAVYSLTGPISIYSANIINAMKMAQEEINATGDFTFNIDLQDDRSETNDVVNVYKKFVERDKKLIILGPLLSKFFVAAAPVAKDGETPVLLTSVSAPGATGQSEYFFRTSVVTPSIIPAGPKAVKEKLNLQKVAIIYGKDDEFNVNEYNSFKKAIDELGINILDTETFLAGDVDFKSQLTKIKSTNPEALVICAQGEEVISISKQAREIGIGDNVRILGGNAFNASNVVKEAGAALEGAISATSWFIGQENQENVVFVKKYKEKFNRDPDYLSAQMYDAMYILKEALKNADIYQEDSITEARKKLKDALAKVKSYKGVQGTFGFDANGDPTISGVVVTVKDGKQVLFE